MAEVPEDVRAWHNASSILLSMLRDYVETLARSSCEAMVDADRARMLADRLQRQFDRGRDMLAGKDPYARYHPDTASFTIHSGEDPDRSSQ